VLAKGSWREITRDAILDAILALFRFDPKEILKALKDPKWPKEVRIQAPRGSKWERSPDTIGKTRADGTSSEHPPEVKPGRNTEPEPHKQDGVLPAGGNRLIMAAPNAGGCVIRDVTVGKGCFARTTWDGPRMCNAEIYSNSARGPLTGQRPLARVRPEAFAYAWPDANVNDGNDAEARKWTFGSSPAYPTTYFLKPTDGPGGELAIVAPKDSGELSVISVSPQRPCEEAATGEHTNAPVSLGIDVSDVTDFSVTPQWPGFHNGTQQFLRLVAARAVVDGAPPPNSVVRLSRPGRGEQRVYILSDQSGWTWLGFPFDSNGDWVEQSNLVADTAQKVRDREIDPPWWLWEIAAQSSSLRRLHVQSDGQRALFVDDSNVNTCTEKECRRRRRLGTWPAESSRLIDVLTDAHDEFDRLALEGLESEDHDGMVITASGAGELGRVMAFVPNDGAEEAIRGVIAKGELRQAAEEDVKAFCITRARLAELIDDNPGCSGRSTTTADELLRLLEKSLELTPTCPSLVQILQSEGVRGAAGCQATSKTL
jgi:hypothetical protein